MLYCHDCRKSFPLLRDLRKHETVHRRLMSCQQCYALFSTADAERAHTQEKHRVSTGCQTDSERSRQHQQRPVHRSSSRLHSERRCPQYSERRRPHWRPAWGSDSAMWLRSQWRQRRQCWSSMTTMSWTSLSCHTTLAFFRATNLYQRVIGYSRH